MLKRIKKLLPLSLLILTSSCANYYFRKANKEFDNYQYSKAISDYKQVIDRSGNHEALIKLAHSYRLVNDFDNAEKYYGQVVGFAESKPINMFYYASVLMSKNNCPEAKIWLIKYLKEVPSDVVAQMLLASCNSVSTFMRDTTLFTLQPMEIPEVDDAFGQVPYKDGIVFTGNKKVILNSKKEPWTEKSYYDLYFMEKDKEGKWLSPNLLKGEINGRYHEGPATFNKAGNIAYFTRSNYFKYKLKSSSKNENNLKIFKAQLVGDKWENLEELPFNNDEYSVGHPCLADDERTLYFISDMPGGYGGTDIYKAIFNGTTWSVPENLGPEINTPGNEMFPFAAADGSFYFSSNAHNNMGGLDVFVTSFNEKTKKWLQVENLNYPLNSNKDDFAFVINPETKSGFVSSNRAEADNVFEFKKHDPTFWLSGKVTYKSSGLPFLGAKITLYNQSSKAVDSMSVYTDKEGAYKVKLKPEADYVIFCSRENFFIRSEEVSTMGKKYSENFVVNFVLDQIVIEKPIVLENIYYDLDKWFIRPDAAAELDKLVKLLNDNPNINIEMGSHTDSRAGDNYNLILSNKRAQAAVEYLVFKGIDASRLTYKGYGETKLVNRCKNDVECSEEEHQQNRRTEFRVMKIVRRK
jgi:peptidoglycan-associated lipoprotein